jgi:hypothetical protein
MEVAKNQQLSCDKVELKLPLKRPSLYFILLK